MHSKLRKVLAGVATAALSLIGLSPLAAVSPAAATGTSTIDFESADGLGFGGDYSGILDISGNHVLKTVHGWETWSGTTITTLNSGEFVSNATSTMVRATINAPVAGAHVRLKLEDAANNTHTVETEYIAVNSGVQTATWDFSQPVTGTAAYNDSYTYNKVSIFYDFGSQANVGSIWTIDNLTYGAAGSLVTYDFESANGLGFGGDYSGILDISGNHVLKTVHGWETWSGTTITTLNSGEFVSNATSTMVRATINAPVAGAHVRLKLEDAANNTHTVETEYIAVNSGVQTATWDFSQPVTGTAAYNDSYTYNKVSIFYDFGSQANVGSIWTIDNLTYGGSGGGGPCVPSGHKDIRLTTPTITPGTNAYNATSWVAQYISAGSAAYIQYITAGTTFSLTYTVTDSCGAPITGQAVSLIVNKDWSCSNATFTAASVTIGPDHCNWAGGQTQLSAQTTDSSGHITFTLTNTNAPATAESLPAHAWEDPTPHTNQVKTNIVPYIDGTESADYYFAHFVRDPNATIAPCVPTATKVIRFLNPAMVPGQNAYDATSWVEPYITKGSKAYLQYLHAGDAMKLTYVVTNNCGTPFANQPVKLKINANWSCSNATFTADGKAVGPDYCNGNGETILAARNTNAAGFVTFDLTNTNNAATAEPTPSSPTSPPSAAVTAAKQEVKTNIQPFIDGTEVIDLYFAHFTRDPQVSLTAPASVVKGVRSKITMNLMGSNGAAAASTRVSFKVTGGGSVAGNTLVGSSSGNLYVVTDASGNASVNYLAGATDSGPVTVTASYTDAAGLTTSKSATFTLADPVVLTPTVKVTGGIGSVQINAVNAKGKSLTVVKAGSRKSYNYGVHGDNETFTMIAAPGNLSVTVFVDGKPQTFQVKVN